MRNKIFRSSGKRLTRKYNFSYDYQFSLNLLGGGLMRQQFENRKLNLNQKSSHEKVFYERKKIKH